MLHSRHKLRPYIIMLFAGIIWAVTFSLAKVATSGGAHPIGLAFWQALGGGLIMAVVCWYRGTWPERSRRSAVRITVIAMVGTALPGTLYFYSAQHVPTGILALTIALVPIMTYAAAFCFKLESYSLLRLAGVGCGFLGIVLLTRPEAVPDPTILPWVILALVCTVCYTTENMFVDLYVPKEINMEGVLFGGLMVSSLFLMPFLLASNSYVPLNFPFGSTEWSVLAMAIINCVSYLAFLYLIQTCGSVFASLMGYVVTLAGVGWGILLFDESHSVIIWITLGLLLVGMGLVKPREALLQR